MAIIGIVICDIETWDEGAKQIRFAPLNKIQILILYIKISVYLMIQSLIHSTEYGNVYLYDDMHMLSLLVHPELKKVCENSENVDPYYLKKYKYLKKYGFFDIPKSAEFGKVNERMVEEGIINVPQILFEVYLLWVWRII